MTSSELRKSFLEFFQKNGHAIVPSSPLVPQDPSVLFTTAGMQQFKEYYLGKDSPYGENVASSQKCFRTSDIEEVGDERHLTFFEMLGNFSFGGYFKKEAIFYAKNFLDYLKIKIDYVTVFEGDPEVPQDKESIAIWEGLGFSPKIGNLRLCPRQENFWGPTGKEGPCGPTTEIYAGGIEIWNIVFNEFFQGTDKKLKPLERKGVDTGMGLERLAMVAQNKKNVFGTDLFSPIVKEIEKQSGLEYQNNERLFRILADHIKGSVFLAAEGILPSNVEQGYILRRLLRRAIRYGKILKMPDNFLIGLAKEAVIIYQDVYPELEASEKDILGVIQDEEEKFEKTLDEGLRELNKLIASGEPVTGARAFDIYQTYGFPLEIAKEIITEKGLKIEKEEEFWESLKKHQEISRAGAEKKFGGVGKEAGYASSKLHTATHLLHAALRQVLGGGVKQMGSDITPQRLRFDFSHKAKMTLEEIKKVEEIVNQKIKEDLEVKREEMPFEQALKSGAVAFFKEKYPPLVSVYSVGSGERLFSKEVCAGPHVKRTSELGHFKIIKEESSGAGVRRIRGVLE